MTIGDRVSTKVTLSNTADIAKAPGTFQVTKTIVGDGAPAEARDKDFAFTYTCSDGQSGQVRARGDGTAVQAGVTFPQGTTCTVKEDAESAGIDGYTLSAPAEQTVTIKDPAEPVATAAFANSYTRDTGAFSIAKSVQGGPQGVANGSYSFTYTCDGGVQGTLSVPGDGTAVNSPRIPTGVSCAIVEDAASAAKDGVLGGLEPVAGLGDHYQGPDRGRHRHQHLHPRHRHLLGHQERHRRLRPSSG